MNDNFQVQTNLGLHGTNLMAMVWVLATETRTVAIMAFQRKKKNENKTWLRYIVWQISNGISTGKESTDNQCEREISRSSEVLACHQPELDRFDQHFQANVNFPVTNTID